MINSLTHSLSIAVLSLCIAITFPANSVSQDLKGEALEASLVSSKNLQKATSSTGAEIPCVNGMADIYPCHNIELLSHLSMADLAGLDINDNVPTSSLNDIWAWQDDVTGDRYAIVGRDEGTSFVNISDPLNPIYVADLPMPSTAISRAWRDMKVYQNYAFIVADFASMHGMQVIDLSQLSSLAGPPVEIQADMVYFGIDRAHNIVINEETGYAYLVGTNTCGGALHVVNIQNPTAPVFEGCAASSGTGRSGTGYVHDAQCVVYSGPDSEHTGKEICFTANETAIAIMDMTDKQAPIEISRASYPNYGYIHQGWLTDDHEFFLLDDELDESNNAENQRTVFWDVRDLDDPFVAEDHIFELGVIDHNQYVKGGRSYQSNYEGGLRVINIQDISSPVESAYFDTHPASNNRAFNGTWSNFPLFNNDIVLINDRFNGLFVVRAPVPKVSLRLKAFLSGPWDGTQMKNDLNLGNLLPEKSPDPLLLSKKVPAGFFASNPEIVDWVTVELRSEEASKNRIYRSSFVIDQFGTVRNIETGGDVLTLTDVDPGSYYVVLDHRNHLPVMSAQKFTFGVATTPSVDFTSDLSSAFSIDDLALQDLGGAFGLWPGDVNEDGFVKYTGANNDRVEVLGRAGGPTPFDFTDGYFKEDVEMNGRVIYSGANNDRVEILLVSGGPTAFDQRKSQVPD